MKKPISLILALLLCLSLSACARRPESSPAAAESTAVPEAETAVEPSGEPLTGTETAAAPESEPAAEEAPAEAAAETVSPEPAPAAETPSPAKVYEPERLETDALSWDFDPAAGLLSIHGSGPMRDYAQNAPEWEQYKDQIRAVALDEGITSVGGYAFFNYLALTEARLPDSVEVIDCSAFDYCWELRSITIPAALKYVGDRAFYNTLLWSPADLVFPEGCEYIGDKAFHSALKSGGIVSLPSTLEYLGEMAFTNAYLSDFAVSENNAFYRSENHAVYSKDGKTMCMLAPVAAHPAEFQVPAGVERICPECFNVIRGIERICLPASVTEISEGAFFSTFELKEIAVDPENLSFKSENGLLLSKDGTRLLAWPDGIPAAELVIPDGVQRLDSHLFYGRIDGTYAVMLPEGLKEIGSMSLPGSMSSLTLPASLEKIGANVFYGGISVGSVTYAGTAADWANVIIEDGNDALSGLSIQMS